jgi:hypothetical protein
MKLLTASAVARAPWRILIECALILSLVFCGVPLCLCASESGPAPEKRPSEGVVPGKARQKTEKESPKKYQWLFDEKQGERSVQALDQSVLLAKLDREIKEARKLYLAGDSDKALERYFRAVDEFESLLDEIPSGHPLLRVLNERFSFFDEVATKTLGPLHVKPRIDMSEHVFNLMERRRICRRLLTLKKAGALQFSDVPKDLLKQESELLQKRLELKAKISSSTVRQTAEALGVALSEIRQSLAKSSPRYSMLMNRVPPKLAEVRQGLLKKDEMVLDFNLLSDRLVVGVITSERAEYRQVEANRSEIDRGVLNLQEMLREFSVEGRSSFMGHAWKEPARRIYRSLLGKLPSFPDGKHTVFVIPDRSLWYLPFSVMLDTDDKPFGRDRLLSCIPSVDTLRFLRAPGQTSEKGAASGELLVVESIPWVAEEQVRAVTTDSAASKKTSKESPEAAGIENLILRSPVYPKPSDIVMTVQKMFKKFNVWVGPTATSERLAEMGNGKERLAVLAVALSVPDAVEPGRHPILFFSADSRARRVWDSVGLFATPIESRLAVLPICWFEVPDSESVSGDGPLLLSLAMFYSGTSLFLLNYSDPDWGSDEPFLLDVFKKISERTPPGKALAEYQRVIPSGLDASFSGKPPNWVGWILIGDPS